MKDKLLKLREKPAVQWAGKQVLKLWSRFLRRPILFDLLLCVVVSVLAGLISIAFNESWAQTGPLWDSFVALVLMLCIFLPLLLTAENLLLLLLRHSPERDRAAKHVELLGLVLGVPYTAFALALADITFYNWDQVIYDIQTHTPVYTGALPSVAVIVLLSLAGYGYLRFVPFGKQPPLLRVLSIAALYLGAAECILWCVQTLGHMHWFICLLPANFVVIAVRTVRTAILAASAAEEKGEREKLRGFGRTLGRAKNLPWLALLAAVPLLGLLVAVLTLFGQEPDSLIRAWTETADWTLSQKTPPPSLHYEGHYLCTVAAGGHRELVKPLREGKRHGERILVNRQLCIANAFEQLLAERTPRFHRALRDFYDRTGYPIAKFIRTKAAADVVYILMKPLEWVFVFTLYLFDIKPENRIAVQYPHSAPPAA